METERMNNKQIKIAISLDSNERVSQKAKLCKLISLNELSNYRTFDALS